MSEFTTKSLNEIIHESRIEKNLRNIAKILEDTKVEALRLKRERERLAEIHANLEVIGRNS